jgi:anti-sigma regulatory factor (Ser/Thr protein kinase)
MSANVSADPGRGRTKYTCDSASIAAARHHAIQQLDDWGLGAHSDAAALLVTELATNAVLHAGSEFELTLTRGHDAVSIVVSDRSKEPPVQQGRDSGAHSGFGLNIVNELSAAWGWERVEQGKRVWANLGTTARSSRHGDPRSQLPRASPNGSPFSFFG